MTEEKFNNAINEYLFLINSIRALADKPFEKEIYITEEVRNTPQISQSIARKSSLSENLMVLDQTKESSIQEVITPTILKKEFLTCSRCFISSLSRVLGEGVQSHPQVFVITDTTLEENEREYLDTILKTIHLNTATNTYITSLVKCQTNKIPTEECYTACAKFLKMQFDLYSPLAAIGFGQEASAFLRQLKNADEYKHCAFIFTRMPFDLKNNIEAKKKVWESFKKLAMFLNLPRV